MDDMFDGFSVRVEPEIITNLKSYNSSYWVLHNGNSYTSLKMFSIVLVEQSHRVR